MRGKDCIRFLYVSLNRSRYPFHRYSSQVSHSSPSSISIQVIFLYVVDYGEESVDLTWADSLSLGANGVGEEGGSEDWILRRSTKPSTAADVSLPEPVYPLAAGGSTIYVNTTGRPQVLFIP